MKTLQTIKITEGAVKLIVPDPKKYKLDSKMPVFYNTAMVSNRDINILLLKALDKKFWVMDLLAASGARGLRIKKEVPNTDVTLNDKNPQAYELIKKNAKLNKLKVKVSKSNAEFRLGEYKQVYNYIDVDPFGTPVPFLDVAVKALKWRGGILAVTATDTGCLAGTYPKACLRKYGSKSVRNELMHETGLRILIKKVQEVGAQYEIALTPIYSHSTLHYMRVYFQADEGALKTDKILKQHGKFQGAGPLWLGQLWDEKLADNITKLAINDKNISFDAKQLTRQLQWESKINTVGFFDIHALAKRKKLAQLPKISNVLAKLEKKGYKAERTHFSLTGIRTNASEKVFIKLLI